MQSLMRAESRFLQRVRFRDEAVLRVLCEWRRTPHTLRVAGCFALRGMHFKTGATPLIRAAREGHLEVVKLLIEKGANVEAKTKYGMPVSRFELCTATLRLRLATLEAARRSGVVPRKLVLDFALALKRQMAGTQLNRQACVCGGGGFFPNGTDCRVWKNEIEPKFIVFFCCLGK